MASYLKPRRGTFSASSAIVLKKGEIFCEFKNNPGTTSGSTSCGAIKMGNGTTSFKNLGYFLNPDTDAVIWASTTADGQPGDWGSYGGTTASAEEQGDIFYDDLNALTTGSQNRKVLPIIKNLLFKLATMINHVAEELDDPDSGINQRITDLEDKAVMKTGSTMTGNLNFDNSATIVLHTFTSSEAKPTKSGAIWIE